MLALDLLDNLTPAERYMATIENIGGTFKVIKEDEKLNSKLGSKIHEAMEIIAIVLKYRRTGREKSREMYTASKASYEKWEWLTDR